MARFSIIMDSQTLTTARDLVRITAGTRGFSLRSVTLRSDVSETPDKTTVGIYRANNDGTGTATTPLCFEDGGQLFDGTASTFLTADTTKNPSTLTGLTASGGSTTTIVDAGQKWIVDAFAGKSAVVTAGAQSGNTRLITSNTVDTLTTASFPGAITNTSVFSITNGTTALVTAPADMASEGPVWSAISGVDDIDVQAGQTIAIRLEQTVVSAAYTCMVLIEQ